METTAAAEGLLGKILPPRLEDAGLEDCALPPESIREAFLKAATAVGSRAASLFSASGDENENDADCILDPWPTAKESSDVLVGIKPGSDPAGPCAVEKGGGMPELIGDEVAAGVTDAEEMVDKVVVGESGVPDGDGEACVDGLQGLKIGEKIGTIKKEDQDEDEEGEKPILAEACV